MIFLFFNTRFNAQTLLIPRPLLDEKTLKILSTNRINISRNNDERTKFVSKFVF